MLRNLTAWIFSAHCRRDVTGIMKYYHYIQNAKAEMLFAQIPPRFLSGLKVELAFDFGVLKGKVAGEHCDLTTTVARVQAIEKFCEKEGLIKDRCEEGTWIRGKIKARSGFFPQCPGLVLFGGCIDSTVLLLFGSEAHLLSGSCNPAKDKGWSFIPRSLHALKGHLESNFELLDIETTRSVVGERDVLFADQDDIESSMFSAFLSLPESLTGPSIEMSFLARIFLVKTNSRGERLAFGSPLYVAD